MANIRLFVCCHKPFAVPEHPLLVPIQVGAALAQEHFPGFVHDDTGENISEKNRSYCELTAQYWAWKNDGADYVGFFHYRRYLEPRPQAKRPYRLQAQPAAAMVDGLGQLTERYDILAPIAEDMHLSVREHYAGAPYHHEADLALVEAIIREKTPEFVPAMERYLSGSRCYFGNIYVMKRSLFHAYCGWLFPILEEFDRRCDLSGYGVQELRVDGYLAERLFGVWLTHVRDGLNVLELPRVHFEPDAAARRKKCLLNALLPPGSRRRAWVKGVRRNR